MQSFGYLPTYLPNLKTKSINSIIWKYTLVQVV